MSQELSADTPPELDARRDVEGQRIYDRLCQNLFGVDNGPTRVGRWQILRKLDRGAMGTVYEAHDPELDRRVAIKVLHAMPPDVEHARRLRLRREAQAMARVKHPNLVEVYDVCTDADQPFVVMELVHGDTLRRWQEQPQRRWRELVTAYLDAARGLAALHQANLIHRDFKPDNALLDHRGRVRVVDFGLVYADGPDPGAPQGPGPNLTRSGALVGTLGYMAPEQLAGDRGDSRSDQFSLCRSLYEAVYRARPFVGDDPESLLAVMRDEVPALSPNPRSAPRWLGRCLRRGLAFAPGARFNSMDDLVEALEHGLAGRTRRRLLTVLGALAVGTGAAAGQCANHACDTVGDQLAGVWDDRLEATLRAAFLAQPGRERDWLRFRDAMRGNREQWIRQRGETCRARRSGEPAWAVQRDRCLDDARLLFAELAHVFESPTSTSLPEARGAANALALQIDGCGRIDRDSANISAPLVAPRVAAWLAEARAELLAGRLERAEASARRALAEANHNAARPAVAETLRCLGEIVGRLGRTDEALILLEDSAQEAVRAGHDSVYVDAHLHAAKLRARETGDLERAERNLRAADDFIARLEQQGVDVLHASAELHEVRAFIALARRDFTAARLDFRVALRRYHEDSRFADSRWVPLGCPEDSLLHGLEIPEDPGLDVMRSLNNLAWTLDEHRGESADPCVQPLYRAAIATSEARLGRLHPVVLELRFDYTVSLLDARRYEDALEALQPSFDATLTQYGYHSPHTAEYLLTWATLVGELGDTHRATDLAARSAALFAEQCNSRGCPPNYGNALIVQAELARQRGDHGLAAHSLRAALDPLQQVGAEEQYADCLAQLAESLVALGRPDEARDQLALAAPLFTAQGRADDSLYLDIHHLLYPSTEQRREDEHAPTSH